MKRFIYTAPLIVGKSETIGEVCHKIISLGIQEALVKNSDQEICGMVCLFDICKFVTGNEPTKIPFLWQNTKVYELMHPLETEIYFSSLLDDLKSLETAFIYHKIPVFLNRNNRKVVNLMGCFDLELFGKETIKKVGTRSLKRAFSG